MTSRKGILSASAIGFATVDGPSAAIPLSSTIVSSPLTKYTSIGGQIAHMIDHNFWKAMAIPLGILCGLVLLIGLIYCLRWVRRAKRKHVRKHRLLKKSTVRPDRSTSKNKKTGRTNTGGPIEEIPEEEEDDRRASTGLVDARGAHFSDRDHDDERDLEQGLLDTEQEQTPELPIEHGSKMTRNLPGDGSLPFTMSPHQSDIGRAVETEQLSTPDEGWPLMDDGNRRIDATQGGQTAPKNQTVKNQEDSHEQGSPDIQISQDATPEAYQQNGTEGNDSEREVAHEVNLHEDEIAKDGKNAVVVHEIAVSSQSPTPNDIQGHDGNYDSKETDLDQNVPLPSCHEYHTDIDAAHTGDMDIDQNVPLPTRQEHHGDEIQAHFHKSSRKDRSKDKDKHKHKRRHGHKHKHKHSSQSPYGDDYDSCDDGVASSTSAPEHAPFWQGDARLKPATPGSAIHQQTVDAFDQVAVMGHAISQPIAIPRQIADLPCISTQDSPASYCTAVQYIEPRVPSPIPEGAPMPGGKFF